MNADQRNLRRKQLDAQLTPLAQWVQAPAPQGGWIRAIREALGMSLEDFARRLNLSSSSTAFQLEKGAVKETVTVKRLRAAADALGCDLMVVLVPRVPLGRYVEEQAIRKAEKTLGRVSQTMDIESQGIGRIEREFLLEQTAKEILQRGGSHLWG